jgi:hypothetical protein
MIKLKRAFATSTQKIRFLPYASTMMAQTIWGRRLALSLLAISLGLVAQSANVTAQVPNPPKVEKADQEIAGIYQLTGVMETGSGLKISPDGDYSWWLSVGSLDLYSEGKWTRQGDEIILGPHQFNKNLPPFELSNARAWSEEDRTAALNMEQTRMQNRAYRVCPFLDYGGQRDDDDLTLPANLSPDQQLAEAMKFETRLKAEYQNAITTYFVQINERDKDGRDDLEVMTRTARLKWEQAADLVRKLSAETGKSVSITSPDLHRDCVLPPKPNTLVKPSDWSNGMGVWIGIPGRPNVRRDIEVTFHYADGSMVQGRSYELGFVFVPATAKKLNRLSLTLTHKGQKYAQSIQMKDSDNAQIFYARPDPRITIDPPFEEARLRIEKGRLVSTSSLGMGGAYVLRSDKPDE